MRRQLLLQSELGVPGSQGLRSFQDIVQYVFLCEFSRWSQVSLKGIIMGLEGEGVAGSQIRPVLVGLVKMAAFYFLGSTDGLRYWVAWIRIGL